MELVPGGVSFDFAKELFPLLLERGEKLLGVALDGYWCDVGSPLSYYRCCADALEGRLKLDPGEKFRRPPAPEAAEAPDDGAESIVCRCRDRAALMGTLSEAMLDMGADYSDGIRLAGSGYRLHISPLSGTSAVRVAVSSQDAEFAHSLAMSRPLTFRSKARPYSGITTGEITGRRSLMISPVFNRQIPSCPPRSGDWARCMSAG